MAPICPEPVLRISPEIWVLQGRLDAGSGEVVARLNQLEARFCLHPGFEQLAAVIFVVPCAFVCRRAPMREPRPLRRCYGRGYA